MSTSGAPATPARGGWLWYGYCGTLIAGAIVPAVPVLAGYLPNGIVAAAGLLLIAAALLVITEVQPAPPIGAVAAGTAALPGVLLLGIHLLPTMVVLLVFPITLVGVVWQGPLPGVGLITPAMDYPMREVLIFEPVVALLLLAAASAVATYAMQRRRTSPLEGLAVGGPAALVLALAAASAPWPTVALVAVVTGLGLMVATGLTDLGPWRRTVLTIQGFVFIVSGLFGCLPTATTTVLGLALVTLAAGVVCGWGQPRSRIPGAVLMVVFAGLTAATAGLAFGQPPHEAAFTVLGILLLVLAVGAALRSWRRRDSSALEGSAHVVALLALPLTANWVHAAELVCVIWALAVGLRSRWPGTSSTDRRFFLVYSGCWWLLTWWLFLGDRAVQLPEAYTLPMAAVAALAAWACRHRWPHIRVRMGYLPAVALAVGPTLVSHF